MQINSIGPSFKGLIKTVYKDSETDRMGTITFNSDEITFEDPRYRFLPSHTCVISNGKVFKVPVHYDDFFEAVRIANKSKDKVVELKPNTNY